MYIFKNCFPQAKVKKVAAFSIGLKAASKINIRGFDADLDWRLAL